MINELMYNFFKWVYFKFRKKVEIERSIKFENYIYENDIENKGDFICGIDNGFCHENVCTKDFDKYGCMYLKGWKK